MEKAFIWTMLKISTLYELNYVSHEKLQLAPIFDSLTKIALSPVVWNIYAINLMCFVVQVTLYDHKIFVFSPKLNMLT